MRMAWERFFQRRRGLRVFSIVVPLCLMAALYLAKTRLLASWSTYATNLFIATCSVAGVVGFSMVMFRVIDRQDRFLSAHYAELRQRYVTEQRLRAQLEALHQASLAIASARDTGEILQRLVDLARDLIGARYAALGVSGLEGGIADFFTSGISAEERACIGPPPTGHGLLGVVLRDGGALRLAEIAVDPRVAGFPPGHPVMHSLLVVPVAQAGSVVGNLYLADRLGQPAFTDEDEELLSMLASHAAVVIEHARLGEQVRKLAVAAERERIRRDLHDGVMQAVFSVNLELEMVEDDLENNPPGARAGVVRAIDRLEGVLRDLRGFVLGLRPEDEADTLPEALAVLLAQTRAHSLLETDLRVEGPGLAALPALIVRELLFVGREAVANVVRHGRAGSISITLQGGSGFVELRIDDNGAGFDVQAPWGPEHQGLRIMRDRAISLGGDCTIQSVEGTGTSVQVRVPVTTAGEEKRHG